MDRLSASLHNLEKAIRKREPKTIDILAGWLDTWAKYIIFEVNFEPSRLIAYKRGVIVLADFGFNAGSEIGGPHYAIVVDNNNNPAANTVMVVPVSSLTHGKTEENLHHSDVMLGCIMPNTDIKSYAKVSQMRAISKLRIIKPKKKNDIPIYISDDALDAIDNQIKLMYTKNNEKLLTTV